MEKCRWRSEPLARIVHCCLWKHCLSCRSAGPVGPLDLSALQDEMCACGCNRRLSHRMVWSVVRVRSASTRTAVEP